MEPDVGTPEPQQLNHCLDTALALRLGPLVAYSLRQLGQKYKCLRCSARLLGIPSKLPKADGLSVADLH